VTVQAAIEPKLPGGFTARPVDPEADAQAVTHLCEAAAIAEYGVSDITLQAVEESYRSPGFDPRTDARLVFDGQGSLVGLGELYDNTEDHVSVYVYVRVLPRHLVDGIGEALLNWAAERGRQFVDRAAPDLRVALHVNVAGANQAMQEIIQRSGWHPERVFWEMEIELEEEPAEPMLPDGIVVRTVRPGVDEHAVYDAQNEAFADHYGIVARSFETWISLATKVNEYDPSLWFLAMDRHDIAGMSLCLPNQLGRTDTGYVGTLGVRPPWRGRGLGLALLQTSFAEFFRRGKRRVALDVDSQSLTGATRLYERAGMHVTRDTRAYELLLRDGRELRTV
jgi:mycothiol synthase